MTYTDTLRNIKILADAEVIPFPQQRVHRFPEDRKILGIKKPFYEDEDVLVIRLNRWKDIIKFRGHREWYTSQRAYFGIKQLSDSFAIYDKRTRNEFFVSWVKEGKTLHGVTSTSVFLDMHGKVVDPNWMRNKYPVIKLIYNNRKKRGFADYF